MNSSKGKSKFNKLRSEYQSFNFEKIDIDLKNRSIKLKFHFSLDNEIFFTPETKIQILEKSRNGKIKKADLEVLAFNIGMIELISYWKAACPKTINVKPFNLSDKQKKFWKKLYFHGLGEFFYLNKIETNIDDFVNIISDSENISSCFNFESKEKNIIPVGGGKDSIVSLELLKESQYENFPLIINPREASFNSVEISGLMDNFIKIDRKIDKKILELNEKGYLNGHTPFSAMLAFTSLAAAYLHNIKNIALSNESSANEATIPGTKVNHQYSKSVEFENDFREYLSDFISPDLNYFSFLRPLSELQIAALFSNFTNYHNDFRSCNVGSKENKWCGKCSKCLFTFIILSPFIEHKKLVSIFGYDMLNDKEMEKYFKELSGIADEKPFECVGTVDEVRAAINRSINKFTEQPYLFKIYQKSNLYNSDVVSFNKNLNTINKANNLTKDYKNIINQALNKIK